MPKLWTSALLYVLWTGALPVTAQSSNPPLPEYGPAELVAELACRAVKESSGIACSRRHAEVLWTHNDSGGLPQVFACDLEGRHLGEVKLRGADAKDWEDMAAFSLDGEDYLLLADTGDNGARRECYELYLIKEPAPEDESVNVERIVRFNFGGGSADCESVAVDPVTRKIILVTKAWSLKCKVYELPLDPTPTEQLLEASQIGELMLPGVTALDITADGRRAVALTYANAFEYTRADDETWAAALARPGNEIKLVARKQSEAVCYHPDGRSLFCTSEACPTPLYRVEQKPNSHDSGSQP
ncbi:MAG: hypothetical protein AAGF97_03295 [Planctomycetota bacterium]